MEESVMRCEELSERLPLLLVDLLEGDEAARVREHLNDGCPACAAELAAAREVLDLLPMALTPDNPSSSVRSRLIAAVKSEEAPPRPVPAPAASRGPNWAYAMAAAAVAALIAVGITFSILTSRHGRQTASLRAAIAESRSELDRQSEEIRSLGDRLREAGESVRMIRAPGLSVIDLIGEGADARPTVRILWDRDRALWHLHASDLPPAPAGRTYQLWFVTPGDRISAALFNTDVNGEASLRVAVPSEVGLIVAAGMTEEPEGGSPQPTSRMRLLGEI
jgi:hypothetical protein